MCRCRCICSGVVKSGYLDVHCMSSKDTMNVFRREQRKPSRRACIIYIYDINGYCTS